MSSNFVFVRPNGNPEGLSLKEISETINSGQQIMDGDTKSKPIDEIQYEGTKSNILKKAVSPTLTQESKNKENKANVSKNGMTGVRLINYDVKKK